MRYPFSPEILDAMPEGLAQLFRELELTLLGEISKRLTAAGQLNEVTVQAIRALRSHGVGIDEIKKAIRNTTGISQQKLNDLFDDVIRRNQLYYKGLADIVRVTAPETLVKQQDIDVIIRQTKKEMANITRTMGFVVDAGQKVVTPTRAYSWVLDKAAMQVQSGSISYNKAIAMATKELADSGITVINYDSGHRDQIDVAVRRAVMTGINQINSRYAEDSMDYLETEYVEVSAHAGARDKDGPLGWENHKKWQGKVYWWKERSKGKPEYKYPEFEKTCGYGSVTGILGANCRHNYSPFIPDVMERTYTDEELANIDPPDFEYEGKKYTHYEATQQQRAIERAVRKWKRREAAATNPEDKRAARVKQRLLKQKYEEFSKAAHLRTQPERMSVYTGTGEPGFTINVPTQQKTIGTSTTVEEVNSFMNSQGWWRSRKETYSPQPYKNPDTGKWEYPPIATREVPQHADLTGCDLESAKSIASSYQQVFERYPQLAGKLDPPDAQPVGMENNTYAWCYLRNNGKVQVNPNKYNSWQSVVSSYENDVRSNWHPYGTTAESIVTHEIGHAIDGLLAREGILGGITASGEYRMASSSLKATIMNRAAKIDSDLADLMMMDKQWKGSEAVSTYISRYATKNPQEWFAECFAEYITSADPRVVASEFGKELEKLVSKLQ